MRNPSSIHINKEGKMYRIKINEICNNCKKEILRDKYKEHIIIDDEFVEFCYCECEGI